MRLIDVEPVTNEIHKRIRYLNETPTIDLMKHGKWVVVTQDCDGRTVISCSNCHCIDYMDVKPNYCWNCGSKNEEMVRE